MSLSYQIQTGHMFYSINLISLFFSVPGRTFPTHPYFQAQLGAGQLSLYNILKAYSLLDPEVSFNSDFISLSLSFCCNSLFPTRCTKWNCQLSVRLKILPLIPCLCRRQVCYCCYCRWATARACPSSLECCCYTWGKRMPSTCSNF